MAVKLDFSRTENLIKVLNFLKSQLPRSLVPWHIFTYVHQNIITSEDIDAQIFVNDEEKTQCLIALYSTPGAISRTNTTKVRSANVSIVCDKQYTNNMLVTMLSKCIPWDRNLNFRGVDSSSITPIIQRYIMDNKLGTYDISTFIQFVLHRDTFLHRPNTNDTEYIQNLGIDIRPLHVNDASLIVEYWPDKSLDEYSVNQTRFCIEKLPTLGAYRQDKLLCWRLLQYDGSLDMVFTVPEARKLGLSSLLSVRLTKEILKLQEHVYGYTAPNNQGSLKTAVKMGFHSTGTSDWIVFQPYNTSKL